MLYVVPTPVGNLEDITLRALRVLRESDAIACEDTRTSSKLLNHYEVSTPRVSYHAHNEKSRASQLVRRMQDGECIALISDAGTPGISDPGFYLVRECLRSDIAVVVLPGASAVLPALVGSGIPCDRFVFEGFLPPKKGRKTRLETLASEARTVVLYESPHRVVRTLTEIENHFGSERRVAAAREISKVHEEFLRGTVRFVREELERRDRPRGEFVIVVEGARRGSARTG